MQSSSHVPVGRFAAPWLHGRSSAASLQLEDHPAGVESPPCAAGPSPAGLAAAGPAYPCNPQATAAQVPLLTKGKRLTAAGCILMSTHLSAIMSVTAHLAWRGEAGAKKGSESTLHA